eukprot:1099777-Prymnesium_polylepis.1
MHPGNNMQDCEDIRVPAMLQCCGGVCGMENALGPPAESLIDDATPTSGIGSLCSPKVRVAMIACAALFLDLCVTTVIVPLLPSYSMSTVWTTLVFLAKPVAELVSNVFAIAPSIADHYGARRPALAGMLFVATGSVLLTVDNRTLLLIARILAGI